MSRSLQRALSRIRSPRQRVCRPSRLLSLPGGVHASSLSGAGSRRGSSPIAIAGNARDGGERERAAAAEPPRRQVKLTVATFGEFGYKELYKEYMAAHPNVEITERITKAEDHHKNLAAHLATNTGAADIEAIEEGWVGQFTAQPGQVLQPQRLRRRGHQGAVAGVEVAARLVGKDGKVDRPRHRRRRHGHVLPHGPVREGRPAHRPRRGVGAVADLGAVHRDRQEVQGGQDAGRARSSTARRSCTGRSSARRRSASTTATRSSWTTNPGVKKAWDLSVAGDQAGLSAKIAAWSPDWNAGFAKGTFATLACPSWMMAYIQTQAKDAAGQVGHRRRCPVAAATGAARA